MTEKEFIEILKKYGSRRFDPFLERVAYELDAFKYLTNLIGNQRGFYHISIGIRYEFNTFYVDLAVEGVYVDKLLIYKTKLGEALYE